MREALRGEEGAGRRAPATRAGSPPRASRGDRRDRAADSGADAFAPAGVRGRLRDWGPPALLLIGLLVLWEVTVQALHVKQFILPGPIAIAVAWQTYLPELYQAASYTFLGVIGGMVIGSTAAIAVGGDHRALSLDAGLPDALRGRRELGADPRVRPAVQQLVRAGRAALEGDDRRGAVLLPGDDRHRPRADDRRPGGVELLRSYAASEAQVFRKLRIPNALPYIFTALRLAATLATIGAVVGEYFAAPRASLGQYIATYSAFLNFERSWAAIVFACAIGIGLYISWRSSSGW